MEVRTGPRFNHSRIKKGEGQDLEGGLEIPKSLFQAALHRGSGKPTLCHMVNVHLLTFILMTIPVLQVRKLRLQTGKTPVHVMF